MVEPDAVFEVADGVLAVGVSSMPGIECDRVAVAVGHEGVVGVVGDQGELRSGRGPGSADHQPAGDAFLGAGLECPPVDGGHVGAVFEPVRDPVTGQSLGAELRPEDARDFALSLCAPAIARLGTGDEGHRGPAAGDVLLGRVSSGHHEAVPVRRADAELFPSPRLPSQLLAEFGTGVFGPGVVRLDVVDFEVGHVAVIAKLGGRRGIGASPEHELDGA